MRGADLVAFADVAVLTSYFVFIVVALPNPDMNRRAPIPIAI
jgi:hypothetical protein